MKLQYKNGVWQDVKHSVSKVQFPVSNVEPDDAYTIREIYDCWRKGKPTSVHPFNAVFDEEGSDFDDSDSYDDFRENPIDRSDVVNDVSDAAEQLAYEQGEMIAAAKQRKKMEQAKPEPLPTAE